MSKCFQKKYYLPVLRWTSTVYNGSLYINYKHVCYLVYSVAMVCFFYNYSTCIQSESAGPLKVLYTLSPLADLFIPAPTQLLWEDYSLIFPLPHICTTVYSQVGPTHLYSGVNWGIVDRTKMPKLRNGSKGDLNPGSLLRVWHSIAEPPRSILVVQCKMYSSPLHYKQGVQVASTGIHLV